MCVTDSLVLLTRGGALKSEKKYQERSRVLRRFADNLGVGGIDWQAVLAARFNQSMHDQKQRKKLLISKKSLAVDKAQSSSEISRAVKKAKIRNESHVQRNTHRSAQPTGGAAAVSVWLPSKKSRGKISRTVDSSILSQRKKKHVQPIELTSETWSAGAC